MHRAGRLRIFSGAPSHPDSTLPGPASMRSPDPAITRNGSEPVALAVALVVAFTCLAAVLHVLCQSGRPLWLDEACTYWTVQVGPGELVRGVRTDGSPPLYFLIVRAVTQALGSSEFVLRLPSMAAATAMVPAIYAVARLFTSPRAAVIAAGLTAVSPLVHYFSVEARSYALVQLETLAIVYAGYRAMLAPRQRRWWLLLCAAQATQLWTHNFALFLLPVPTIVCLVAGRHERWKLAMRAMAAAAAAFALDVPWFLQATTAAGSGVGDWINAFWLKTPPFAAIVRSLEVFGFGGLYPPYLSYLGKVPAFRMLAIPMSLGLLGLAALPWAEERPRREARIAVKSLLCFLFVPLVGAWLYSWFRQPLYLVGRYDTIVLPIFLILFAIGLEKLLRRRPWIGGIVATVVVGLAAVSLSTAFRTPADMTRDAMAAEQLALNAKAGDLIVATGLRRPVISYYLDRKGNRASMSSFPAELEEHPGWRSRDRLLLDRQQLIADAARLSERMAATAREGHAVWLLSSGPNEVDDYLFRSLPDHLIVDETRSRRRSGLILLTHSPDGESSPDR